MGQAVAKLVDLPIKWLDFPVRYPLVMSNIAIEHGDLEWNFPLKMVIFHSYVSLPEGKRLL